MIPVLKAMFLGPHPPPKMIPGNDSKKMIPWTHPTPWNHSRRHRLFKNDNSNFGDVSGFEGESGFAGRLQI